MDNQRPSRKTGADATTGGEAPRHMPRIDRGRGKTLPWTFYRPATTSEAAILLERVNQAASGTVGGCMANTFPHGTVHEARDDLQAALRSDPKVFVLWESLTPLGRNEFICWVDDAKQPKTRQSRIERTCDELLEGKKRPCCWTGCIHRTDKAPSPWQQAVLIDRQGRKGRKPA